VDHGKIVAMDLNDRLRRASISFPEVKLAVLFGSTARGQARPKSDVDLGILLEPYSADLRFRVEAELGRAAGREVDTVLLDDAPPLLRFEIARDGILLFEREDQLWTVFKTRAMVDWWDWAPTHRMIAAGVAKRLREQVSNGQA
jgi:predicted nucleotidyltransferase